MGQRVECFLHRCVGIGLMHEVHVQSISAESSETPLDLCLDTRSREAALVVRVAQRIPDLRAHEDRLTDGASLCRQPSSYGFFAAPAAVCVGCVEHRDAEVRRLVHEREGRVGVLPHPKETRIRTNTAEVTTAQNEPGDFEVGITERTIFHAVFY